MIDWDGEGFVWGLVAAFREMERYPCGLHESSR